MSTDDSTNDSSLDCFMVYDNLQYNIVVGLRSAFSLLSCVFLVFMCIIIIIFQKYNFFTQRLILYLVIVSFCYSLSGVFNVTGTIAYKDTTALTYCKVIGFFEQITSWWEILATTCILISVFIQSVFERATNRLEVLYVILIFVTPLTFSWIPYLWNLYGPSGEYCWITPLSLNDCSRIVPGVITGYAIYAIPYFVVCVVLLFLLIIAFVFVRRKQKMWTGKYNPESAIIKKMMEKEIKSLIFYPVMFLMINVIPFIRRVYELYRDDDVTYYVLTIGSTVILSFQGIFIALVFIADPETRMILNYKTIYSRCCGARVHKVSEYPIEYGCGDSASQTSYAEGFNTPYSDSLNS